MTSDAKAPKRPGSRPAGNDTDRMGEPEPQTPGSGPVDEAGNSAGDVDPETVTASLRTRALIHDLAVGLTRFGSQLERLLDEGRKQADEARASPAGQRVEAGLKRSRDQALEATERVREKAEAARLRAAEALHRTDDLIGRARAVAVGLALKAEETTEETVAGLHRKVEALTERAKAAREAGSDFFADHREEILALLFTAAKVAAVIGVRRLAAPREADEGLESDQGRKQAARRLVDAGSVLFAVVTQVGDLLARNPSALPMLREMYARGEPSEQAVVGMLLGPTLSSDPDHAVEVVHEFLESATSGGAADTIAKRTLAPLLEEHPRLVEHVLPWIEGAAPFVRRAALLALTRFVADRRSRVGDIVAAAVVVLEDHDEEVRQALGKLFRSAAAVDPEATASALADRLDAGDADTRRRTEELVAGLPDAVKARIAAVRTDREA